MKNTIKFFWNGIKVNGKLNKFRFHFDSINYGVNFYADDYEAEMPEECGVAVINNSDSQTDYFEKDHGYVTPEHPLFKFFAHAARQARVHYCKNQIKQNERMAKKYGSDYSVQTSKCESEIAEMEIWENPGQPTAEDFEKVEAYVAEIKAKAEAARNAEEEREHTARLVAINEAKVKTQNTIARAVKMYPVTEGAPVVEVPFSEFVGLYDIIDKKQNTWSVKAADMILGELDMWQHEKRETSDAYGWYEKTDFTIRYTDENGEESSYRGRYDLGDGEGGLLNHIRNFGEWHRTHEEFGAEKKNPDETNEILEFVKMLEKAA